MQPDHRDKKYQEQRYRKGIYKRIVPPSLLTEMRGAAMSITAAASGLVVFLLSVSVVQGQGDWGVACTSTEICAVKGSIVEINCTYKYPSTWDDGENTVEKTFWFTKQKGGKRVDLTTVSEYAGRVEDLCENNTCTLRIRNLTESDSAEYWFRIITTRDAHWGPPVTLSVTDLQVEMSRSLSSTLLQCLSSCPPGHTSYIWSKNRQKVKENTSPYADFSYDSADSYSCALKGYEGFPSPSVYRPKPPAAEIAEGSSVTLTCSNDDNPTANYTWYKKNGSSYPPPFSDKPLLVFSSIQFSDSGQYYCTAENLLGSTRSESIFIDVKYGPKLPSVSVSPSAEIEEGSSVTLTCSSDANPAANYIWYKENQTVFQGAEGSYHFTSISSEDRGIYYCKSENQYGENKSSLSVDVQYAPKLPSVSVSPSAEIEEGSSVTLTCSSDANPAANYTWYKEDEDSPKASGQIFNITDFRAEHSGSYYCGALNKLGRSNSTLHLSVVAGSSTMIVNIMMTLGVLMLIPVFLLCLWTRKKKALCSTTEAREPEEIEV